MSRTYISVKLREEVKERAGHKCEYCLMPAEFSAYSFHIDHVISEKQGGETSAHNLAHSCPDCNFNKGSDISAYMADNQLIVDLFNPRKDLWSAHFELELSGELKGISKSGVGTIRLLKLNSQEKVGERFAMIKLGIQLL